MSTQQDLTPEGVLADIGYPGFVQALFNRSGDMSKDFAHAILGIATELNELHRATDSVNRDEEFGDLGFYAQALINLIEEYTGTKLTDEHVTGLALNRADELFELIGQTHGYDYWDAIEDTLASLLDKAKRWVGYPVIPDFDELLADAGGMLMLLGFIDNLGPADYARIELQNVAKLLKRYKGLTFSTENAVNRDLPAERAVLEQNAA